MGKYNHICKNCGKEFDDYCKTTKFCSRSCYDDYRKENGKLKELICPICKKSFRQKYSKQIFCSVECRVKSTEKKVKCICEYCGEEFYRIQSEVDKNKRHYCSIECKEKAMWWSDADIKILQDNYGKLSYKEMIPFFSTQRTVKEIRRKAISIGITSSRKWTNEETAILINNYSTKPMNEVINLLPHRTQSSILGKAKLLGLKSYFYLNRVYTEEDEQYLRDNYLNKNNKELAEALNRAPGGIAQHLWFLKLYRPNDRSGYTDLSEYIRGRLIPWFKQVKRNNNFTCSVTGSKSNIIVHHIHGFNLILDEAVKQINFPIYDNISDYSDDQLDKIFTTFYDLQESYKSYICITEEIHKQFHSIYGYGNNTKQQWDEFIETYYKN